MIVKKVNNLIQICKHQGLQMAVRAFLNLLDLTYKKYVLRNRYIVKNVNGCKMCLDINDRGISRTLAIFGTREIDQIFVLKRELKEGMVVLDIGANIGCYALLEARLVKESGRVYAVEPSPENFHLLNRNVRLNNLENIIQTFQFGISDRTALEKLYLSESSNLHTFYPNKYTTGGGNLSLTEKTIDVQTITISDFAVDKEPIDFIRMDIEGYEIEAFHGMLQILETRSFAPKVLFETHRPKYDEKHHNMRDILGKLFEFGYYVKTIISNDEPKGKFRNRGYKPERLIKSDFVLRGIYQDVSEEDALYFICDVGYVRAVLLERKRR